MSKRKRKDNQEEHMEASNATLTTRVKDEGFWKEMWRQARLVWQLIRSPEVPLYLKILPALALVYILVPTDFIPDVFPVIGQLDDLTALLVGAKVFIELAPQDVVAKHVRAMRQTTSSHEVEVESGARPSADAADSIVIEGDFLVVDDENNNRAN